MFSFRYHITSLVAVFLALTVGLLLGSALVDSGSIARRQEGMLTSIKEDLAVVRDKDKALQIEVSELRRFSTDVLKVAIHGRLDGERVAVVTLSANNSGIAAELGQTLVKSGATAGRVDIDTAKIDLGNKELVDKLTKAMGAESTETSFEKVLWPQIARELSGASPPKLLDALVADDLATIGDKTILPATKVVLVAPRSGAGNRDTLLVNALRDQPDLVTVGVETSKAEHSRMSAYQVANIATVDNVDTAAGKISLVYLLDTGEKGKFGVKSSADRLLP